MLNRERAADRRDQRLSSRRNNHTGLACGNMPRLRSRERMKNGGRMRRLHVFACALVALIGTPALGFGQWIRYPTPDMPRKADGKPDLTAPTPRLSDGHPD